MKKVLVFLVLLSLTSCSVISNAVRQRRMYDIWFPGKAAQKGKTPCKNYPTYKMKY